MAWLSWLFSGKSNEGYDKIQERTMERVSRCTLPNTHKVNEQLASAIENGRASISLDFRDQKDPNFPTTFVDRDMENTQAFAKFREKILKNFPTVKDVRIDRSSDLSISADGNKLDLVLDVAAYEAKKRPAAAPQAVKSAPRPA